MKTIQQLNQEFLNEYTTIEPKKNVAASAVIQEASAVVTETRRNEINDKSSETRNVTNTAAAGNAANNVADTPAGSVVKKATANVEATETEKAAANSTEIVADTTTSTTATTAINHPATRTTYRKAPQRPSAFKELQFLLLKIGLIALAFVLLFTFMFGLIRYNEPSMAPAIKDGDLVIFHRYNESGYMPRDMIALEKNGQAYVRRVVATAGDTVDITEDGLLINGALQQEPEIFQATERYQDGIDFPMIVPEAQVFVLSDSRTGATDSRIYGSVEIKDTLGKVMAVIRRRNI